MKYVSSFHSFSLCFVTSIFQIFWSVSSFFRVFPIYFNRFICYETEMGLYKKKMYVSSFHSVSPCFVTSFEQVFCTVTSCFRVFLIYLIRFICLFVLRFYGPVNPMGSCRVRSVYLTTHLLGRLSPLSG